MARLLNTIFKRKEEPKAAITSTPVEKLPPEKLQKCQQPQKPQVEPKAKVNPKTEIAVDQPEEPKLSPEELAEIKEKLKLKEDYTSLMDAAWHNSDLAFLQDLSYQASKAWFEHMLETWKSEILPTLKDEDAGENTPVIAKALAVKAWRKERNARYKLEKKIAGK